MKKNLKPQNTKLVKILKNKTILITGGSGSLGSKLTEEILLYPVKSVRILDIDEHGLFKLGRSLNDSRLRLLLGNILDKERIEMAGKDADIIFHTAAIKNIEISELNPIETIETNVTGTVNLIKMCTRNKPQIFINISTDKAANPSTLYGTTKQLSEKLTTWAGLHIPTTKFASIRFGNLMESRGNVFEIWEEESKNNIPLSITDPNMKRYFFHTQEAVNFILKCIPLVKEGEIFIPKMNLFKIRDLAKKISLKHKVIGHRPGEKMKEILLTDEELKNTLETDDMWILKSNSK